MILNVHYPFNQPKVHRCLALGKALQLAIQSFNGCDRVAVMASGGLSHFVIDEDLDQKVLSAMATGDESKLAQIPESFFKARHRGDQELAAGDRRDERGRAQIHAGRLCSVLPLGSRNRKRWKSSYRLLFTPAGEPTLEGWAIVDNTSGEDWNNVKLSVVSGRPISFITQLYQPRYVQRPAAELAEDRPAGPQVFQGALSVAAPAAPSPAAREVAKSGGGGGRGGARNGVAGFANSPHQADGGLDSLAVQESSFASLASGQDTGELFEYSFAGPVTVKTGESAMLPFLQQHIGARKLLIYTDNMGLHPMNAAEVANSSGKTLDGGPITVYDAGAYAGEAMVETLKAGDKRLISYGVDLGMRISTAWDSSRQTVREIHSQRGLLTTRTAIEETKTYTIANVDARPKTLVIEYPQRPGYRLMNQAPTEKTSSAYRFEVKVAATSTTAFPVAEERILDQSTQISSLTPDGLNAWIQNQALSDAGRVQLEQIARKKAEIASSDAALEQVHASQASFTQDQERRRENIRSLNAVAGQQDQVQQYARQLAAAETRLAALRDQESDLSKKRAQLQGELNALIEKAAF